MIHNSFIWFHTVSLSIGLHAVTLLLVLETCRRFSTFLKDSKVTLWPWIQAFPFGAENFNEEYILEQLRALDQSESRGMASLERGERL
jgi:hypothetical protein